MQKLTIFGRITGGGGAGRSKPAIKVNKVLVYLLINGLVRTQTLEPNPIWLNMLFYSDSAYAVITLF